MLIITGSLDAPFCLAAAAYLQEKLPHAQCANLQQTSHMVNMEKADSVNGCHDGGRTDRCQRRLRHHHHPHQPNRQAPLVWTVSLIAFFLSPVLDNLTTSIVMVSLLRKLIDNPRQRLVYIGMVIIAVNAGGVWSPMGDVTTTMLWIGRQASAKSLVLKLLLPSLACLLVPLAICSARMKGTVRRPAGVQIPGRIHTAGRTQYLVLVSGVLVLLSVPLFKVLTGLPPFMGMLIGLGVLWIISEIIHRKETLSQELTLTSALQRIDSPSILFFLGILLSVGAMEAAGMLQGIAQWFDTRVESETVLATGIGVLSSVVDNVPLVAASQAMYGLDRFATDHTFWMLLTYATGTGGSILLIGSAAGVAAMGMESIPFVWYLKKITQLALIGFFPVPGYTCCKSGSYPEFNCEQRYRHSASSWEKTMV